MACSSSDTAGGAAFSRIALCDEIVRYSMTVRGCVCVCVMIFCYDVS